MTQKILFAVITCGKFKDRADAQRETWVIEAKKFSYVDVKFFLGTQDREPLPDEVFLDVDDSYLGLPQKVQCAIQWARENDYTKMVKLDDDVFVFPDRLLASIPRADYVGQINGEPPFCSGFCYWLSWKAMKYISAAELPDDPQVGEDRFVSTVLRDHGIRPTGDPQIYTASCLPRTADVNSNTKACAEFTPEELKKLAEGPKGWAERSRIAAEKARRHAMITRGDGTRLFG